LLLGTPWININNVVHKKVANRYSFNYNGRKITLKSMTAAEILREDLLRVERRKNEPFRKEWAVLDGTTNSYKSKFLQNDDIVLPIVGTNILQHESENEDKVTEKEQVNISGKSSLDVLNCPSNDANNAILVPSLELPLSQVEKEHDNFDLEQCTCAEKKIIMPITCAHDELKLLSSLNTLGYVEFDTLCALSSLEEKILCADLPWLSRCIYHFIGKYNCKGEYMVHRVYICSNLKSPFVAQQHDQLEGYNHNNHVMSKSPSSILKQQVKFLKEEHHWLIPTT